MLTPLISTHVLQHYQVKTAASVLLNGYCIQSVRAQYGARLLLATSIVPGIGHSPNPDSTSQEQGCLLLL